MPNDKTQQLKAALTQLANSLITDPDQIDRFVRQWANGFHRYSFGNLLLIMFQKPDATLCAGYHDWLTKHHRYVKKGESGIGILAPIITRTKTTDEDGEELEETRRYFRTVYVFDVSQTDGEPIKLGHSAMVTGHSDLDLDAIASLFPYPIDYEEHIIENGRTDGNTITLAKRDNPLSVLATYFHELAHCLMKHPGDAEKRRDRSNIELEAEAVSYSVSSHFGIHNDRSRYYISHWKGDCDKLAQAGNRVVRTAGQIIKTIDERKEV